MTFFWINTKKNEEFSEKPSSFHSFSRLVMHNLVKAVEKRKDVDMEKSAKKYRFGAKVAEFFELPSEVVLDLPRLVLTGKQQLLVENHRGLRAYSCSEICLQTSLGELRVSGEALAIKLITQDQVNIDGRIGKVEWGKQGERNDLPTD
jgi:sporulation protein YqfC